MRSVNKRAFVATSAALLLAISVFVILGGFRGAAQTEANEPASVADAQALADRLLPGSQVGLAKIPNADPEGEVLTFEFSSGKAQEILDSKDQEVSALRNIGWRARLIASVFAQRRPGVAGYQVGAQGVDAGDIPVSVIDAMYGYVPTGEFANDSSTIGTVSREELGRQINSNLETIEEAFPNISASVTELDLGDGSTAFDVNMVTSRPELLKDQIGDLIVGPQLGLAGDNEPLIEGEAIAIHSEKGQLLAGSWTSARSGYSALSTPSDMKPGTSLKSGLEFRNLTDGPWVTSIGSSTTGEIDKG